MESRNQENFQTEIARRIRLAREDVGLNQTEVAERLGIERAAYGHIETGRSALKIEHLPALSEVLNRPITYFLGLSDPRKISEDEAELLRWYNQLDAKNRRFILGTVRFLVENVRRDNDDQS